MARDRVFLDANVLFSAAYGSPQIGRLWDLHAAGRCMLLVSAHVIDEARRNLPDSAQRARLDHLASRCREVADAPVGLSSSLELPAGDQVVFLTAVAAEATHLLTGDVRHFGPYLNQRVQGVGILRPAAYLGRRSQGTNR